MLAYPPEPLADCIRFPKLAPIVATRIASTTAEANLALAISLLIC
jgi:hypothetical protein